MTIKNNNDSNKPHHFKKRDSERQNRRLLHKKTIQVELDLDNREILVCDNLLAARNISIETKNIETFIGRYIHPCEAGLVMEGLVKAGKGIETPIIFNFIHPGLPKTFRFEYHYRIIYVSYAKTRLKGELIEVSPKP